MKIGIDTTFLVQAEILEHPGNAQAAEYKRRVLASADTFALARKRILDTMLAATYFAGGVDAILTSNPGDFEVFKEIQTVTP